RHLDDLLGAAGGAPHRGPDPGDARGPADRRVLPRGGLGGEDHVRGHRPAGARGMSATVDTRQETAGGPPRISSRRLTERVFRTRESGIIVVLVVFVAVTVAIEPRFASQQEVHFILANTTIFALLALGETMVIVSRNVDLSIGSVVGLSAYVSASLFGKVHGIPIVVVFLTGL